MIVQTKKYQLDQETYIKIAMKSILKEWWWVWFIPAAVLGLFVALGMYWWGIGLSVTMCVLYILFWLIQFAGVTQHQNFKVLFDKYTYEISSKNILMKIEVNKGMPIEWNKIQKAVIENEAFILTLSRAQFIHLPFKIFKNAQDIKFVEMLLRRKNLISTPQGKKEESKEVEKP